MIQCTYFNKHCSGGIELLLTEKYDIIYELLKYA